MGEVNRRRLARHGLADDPGPLASLPEAAAAMAGAHAQVMSAAELSLALRVADTTRADVAAALWDERSLVKTFGPRGTVHLLPAADLSWWLAALGSVPTSGGHPDGVRLTARRDRRRGGSSRRRAARGGPHHRGARRIRRRGVRAVGGRGVDGGVRRLLAAVAAGAGSRGGARGALLRAEPRPQDHLREPEPLALRPGAPRPRRGTAGPAPRLPRGVRPRDAGAPGPVAGHVAGVDERALRARRPRRGRPRG